MAITVPFRDIRDRAIEGASVERFFFLLTSTVTLAFLITGASAAVTYTPNKSVVLTVWMLQERRGSNVMQYESSGLGGDCGQGATRMQAAQVFAIVAIAWCTACVFLLLMEVIEKPVRPRAALIAFAVSGALVFVAWITQLAMLMSPVCEAGRFTAVPLSSGYSPGPAFVSVSVALLLKGAALVLFVARRFLDRRHERREVEFVRRRHEERLKSMAFDGDVMLEGLDGAEASARGSHDSGRVFEAAPGMQNGSFSGAVGRNERSNSALSIHSVDGPSSPDHNSAGKYRLASQDKYRADQSDDGGSFSPRDDAFDRPVSRQPERPMTGFGDDVPPTDAFARPVSRQPERPMAVFGEDVPPTDAFDRPVSRQPERPMAGFGEDVDDSPDPFDVAGGRAQRRSLRQRPLGRSSSIMHASPEPLFTTRPQSGPKRRPQLERGSVADIDDALAAMRPTTAGMSTRPPSANLHNAAGYAPRVAEDFEFDATDLEDL